MLINRLSLINDFNLSENHIDFERHHPIDLDLETECIFYLFQKKKQGGVVDDE